MLELKGYLFGYHSEVVVRPVFLDDLDYKIVDGKILLKEDFLNDIISKLENANNPTIVEWCKKFKIRNYFEQLRDVNTFMKGFCVVIFPNRGKPYFFPTWYVLGNLYIKVSDFNVEDFFNKLEKNLKNNSQNLELLDEPKTSKRILEQQKHINIPDNLDDKP